MNILITGGSGFIGSHIADKYIEAGHKVTVLADPEQTENQYLNSKAELAMFSCQSPELDELFGDMKFDLVSHHGINDNGTDRTKNTTINIMGSLNLLETMVRHDVKRIIAGLNSDRVYGKQNYFPANENHPLNPYDICGINQATVENYLEYFRRKFKVNFVSFRYAKVYGPRQELATASNIVIDMIRKMTSGKSVSITGHGVQTRDLIYIEDVVAANLAALEFDVSNEVFNIGSGIEVKVNELFDMLKIMTGYEKQPNYIKSRILEKSRGALEWKKARELLNWEPKVSLSEGLEKTIDYFSCAK